MTISLSNTASDAAGAPPAPADLAGRLGRLPSERRAALLTRMRRRTSAGAAAPHPLEHQDRGALPAASFQQEQMWFVDKLGDGKARNTICLRVDILGPLDESALRTALDTIVDRHVPLHSRLVDDEGVARTATTPTDLGLSVQHLGEPGPGSASEADLERLLTEFAVAPFHLETEAPVRATLLRLSPEHNVLAWAVHHIAWDPRSTAVFAHELRVSYEAACAGRPAGLPELTVDYSDYAAWQRGRLSPARSDELARGWRAYLDGAAATEVLPDLSRTARGRGTGARLQRRAVGVCEAVHRLAEEAGTTPFAVQLAAFNVLLHTWSHSGDVVVATAAASRPHGSLNDLIGCFVNMVPIRTHVHGSATFAETVRQTAGATTTAFELSELPFERIVEAVRPPRDPARHPVFQIEFTSLGRWDGMREETGNVSMTVEQLHDGSAKFDMSLLVGEAAGDALDVFLEYDVSLYTPALAEHLIDGYVDLLEGLTRHPDDLVSDVVGSLPAHGGPVESAAPVDRDALATDIWSAFTAVAAEAPEAVAVRATTPIGYGQLYAWAGKIAAHLRENGVASGDLVAICMDRTPESIASVLGVLAAGAAYVPVAPGTPAPRVAAILGDCGATVALAAPHHEEVFAGSGVTVLTPTPAPPAADRAPDLGGRSSGPRDLAYVLYTSGTTGTPKGVMIEQRSVVHFSRSIARAYDMTREDTTLHFAPLTFDVSVFEIFAPLLSGGSLVVASDEERRDPERLQVLLQQAHVSVAELPPALLPMMDPSSLPDLRLVSVGGEAFLGSLVAEWSAGGRRFMNGYGPTETTVAVTLKDCRGTFTANPPIGRPMAGHQALILDPERRTVPEGVPGELCIAGPGVARGYLGIEKTSAFFENPWATDEYDRVLYATGDLVRLRPDGDIEFLGRTDRQLKIRGFRVEPAEIETLLVQHPDVLRAVVVAHKQGSVEASLVAYVTATPSGAAPQAETLRQHLASLLPAYLVPVVHVVDDIPLTAHGKLDLSALPAPSDGRGHVTPPRDEIEQRLCDEIIDPILEWDAPDVEGDFFAYGGSSLQATSVVSKVRSAFDVDIPLADFFGHPTVAHLATLVREARSRAASEQDRLMAMLAQIEAMTDNEAASLLATVQGEPQPDGGS